MSIEFLSRRQLFGCTGALVLTAVVPGLARSASEPPINDVLSGVGDAADRQRLRQEARKGQWDGQYWNEDGKGIPPVNTATICWATPGHKQVVRPKLRPAATTVSLTVPVHLCLVRAWCPIRRALRCATPRTKRFLVSRQVRDAEPEASAEAAGCADEFLFVVFSTSTKPARNLLHSCRFCFSEFF